MIVLPDSHHPLLGVGYYIPASILALHYSSECSDHLALSRLILIVPVATLSNKVTNSYNTVISLSPAALVQEDLHLSWPFLLHQMISVLFSAWIYITKQ